jgi:predicted GIY-YIG superfamily endonuclease
MFHYVYYLQTEDSCHWYVGVTNNLKRRLFEHNNGLSRHTSKYLQHQKWKLMSYFAFPDRRIAEEFEDYLKSQSGREFAKKHFTPFANEDLDGRRQRRL